MEQPDAGISDAVAGFIVLGMCLFALLALVAVIVGVVVLMRRKQAPPGQATPPGATGDDCHLSVLAIAFDVTARPHLEAALAQAAVLSPTAQFQHLCRAVAAMSSRWTHFGYGEKPPSARALAEDSFRFAVEDFGARARSAGDGGALTVLVIITLTRGLVAGVGQLHVRDEAQTALEARATLPAESLLGLHLLWAPPRGGFSSATLQQRFPEMQPLIA